MIKYIFVILLLTSCSTKIKTVEVIKDTLQEVVKIEEKIDKVEKEYIKLVEKEPVCENQTISTSITIIKNDIRNLENRISISIYVAEEEINGYKKEIKHIRIKKNIAWTITFLVLGGTSYFIIKRKLYD